MTSHAKSITYGLSFTVGMMLAAACGPQMMSGQEKVSPPFAEHAIEATAGPVSVSVVPARGVLPPPQWEVDAGGRMSSDVASVQPSTRDSHQPPGHPTSNVPLDPGAAFTPTGGLFQATNTPLLSYIVFAYRLNFSQAQALQKELPEWSLTDQFDIQAKTTRNPSKDQLRLMVQSLLAER